MQEILSRRVLFPAAFLLMFSTPVVAHTGQNSVVSALVHFMTEPDHLMISVLVATALVFVIRKATAKRS